MYRINGILYRFACRDCHFSSHVTFQFPRLPVYYQVEVNELCDTTLYINHKYYLQWMVRPRRCFPEIFLSCVSWGTFVIDLTLESYINVAYHGRHLTESIVICRHRFLTHPTLRINTFQHVSLLAQYSS